MTVHRISNHASENYFGIYLIKSTFYSEKNRISFLFHFTFQNLNIKYMHRREGCKELKSENHSKPGKINFS